MRLPGPSDARGGVWLAAALAAAVAAHACADPERDRLKATTKPTYDKATGRLTELTFDANKNGKIDTWTEMDGDRPLRSRIDQNEDGRPDRWEYYDEKGKLAKVGFSRKADGKPDAWAYATSDGRIDRIEVSSVGDEHRIDRWEYYEGFAPKLIADGAPAGSLLRVEEDTNRDGRADKWERYVDGVVASVEFDENGDGRRDRRLTYRGGELVLIETAPDASGTYTKTVKPQE
jgi:hypothetical protein